MSIVCNIKYVSMTQSLSTVIKGCHPKRHTEVLLLAFSELIRIIHINYTYNIHKHINYTYNKYYDVMTGEEKRKHY